MVRMVDLPKIDQKILLGMKAPIFENRPWVNGAPLNQRRVAMITTAFRKRKTTPVPMGAL